MNDADRLYQLKLAKLERLREEKKKRDDLPHLYGWPWYKWAREFFDSKEEVNLLCAANQISKSSTQIRKCIDWATDMTKWDDLWGRKPNQFWYLYPSKEVATVEFEKKWVPEFMPRGEMKQDPIYGWKVEYDKKHIVAIHFRSGVSVYFKTYAQNASTLQSGSVFAIFCDEELPVDLYDELQFRLAGTQGYFHMVFTATLGQQFWWQAMECIGKDEETLKGARKRQISMYDCLEYLDGSKSPWTHERIKKVEAKCKSKAEILKRVHGRFVKEEGRKFHAFDPGEHYCEPFKVDSSYNIYVGVDIGSGGQNNHPSAIVVLAIAPDFEKAYVINGWRGDGIETTPGDVYEKYKEITKGIVPVGKYYDGAAKDFGIITERLQDIFEKAEKSHELGEDIINTLFRNNMLKIFNTEELRKLGNELLMLQKNMPKNKAKDDFCDALRYSATKVPWNFSIIQEKDGELNKEIVKESLPKTDAEWQAYHIEQRRKEFFPEKSGRSGDRSELDEEFDYWNEVYGN